MATTGTTAFTPSIADILMNAFARIQLRRTELTQQHLIDGQNEANLVQVEFANRQPNLWTSNLFTVALTPGTATYTLPADMICFSAVYIRTTTSTTTIDQLLFPLSSYEYSAITNKSKQGRPTQYWFDRQIIPEITLWLVPDDIEDYTLYIRYLKQIEDAALAEGTTPQIPYRWNDAFVSALAARLAQIYKPEMVASLDAKAERAWQIAAREDTEDVPMYVTPMLRAYQSW